MADIEQMSPLGAQVSYNNASLSLAGRIIEKITGTTFEQAMADLLLVPLGLANTYFFPNDIMTRRFAVGHRNSADGTVKVLRPWALPRNGNPAGGIDLADSDARFAAMLQLRVISQPAAATAAYPTSRQQMAGSGA